MKIFKKTTMVGLAIISASMLPTAAKAIPIPTIGMSELVQNLEMVKQSIEQAKQQFEQIKNGVEQAKNMGGKLSLDGLKGMIENVDKISKSVTIPPAAKKIGLTEEVVKEPEKVKDWVQGLYKSKEGEFDPEQTQDCRTAVAQMIEENTTASLSESLATQTELASGADMKEAQEAVNSSSDQMQMLGANSKILQKILKLKVKDTKMQANDTTSASIGDVCR
ncbi:unknown [Acetobacter sp. CAG:977]|nr:unknown [Acetobacter sp. CAG:977]